MIHLCKWMFHFCSEGLLWISLSTVLQKLEILVGTCFFMHGYVLACAHNILCTSNSCLYGSPQDKPQFL